VLVALTENQTILLSLMGGLFVMQAFFLMRSTLQVLLFVGLLNRVMMPDQGNRINWSTK
jgi:hypothetical protein